MASLDGEVLKSGVTCPSRESIRVELGALVMGVHSAMSI